MDSKTALSELKNFQANRKGAADYYKQSQQELGVGEAQARQNELKDTIRNTEAQLKGVGESVAGRTRGNLVTEAQRARLQSLEERPIAETLSSQQGAYSDAAQNYRDLLSQAGTQSGMMYQSDADRQAALQNQYTNLFQQEQADAARRQQEEENRRWWENYNESKRQFQETLAANERQYQRTLAENAKQRAAAASLYNQSIATSNANAERDAAIAAEAQRIATEGGGSTGGVIGFKTDNNKSDGNIFSGIGDWFSSLFGQNKGKGGGGW